MSEDRGTWRQDAMTLRMYADRRRPGVRAIPSGIRSRWRDRVVCNGWDRMGETGAVLYLKRYGRRIGAPKCIHLAVQAERTGNTAMARGFWRKAYEIELGHAPPNEDGVIYPARRPVVAPAPVPPKRREETEDLDETVRRVL